MTGGNRMNTAIVLTDDERRAVAHQLRHDHDMHDIGTTVDRVIAAVNVVRGRPRSEASR
jgi:hypothetical protein